MLMMFSVTSVVEFDKKEERRLLRKLGRLSRPFWAFDGALTEVVSRFLHLGMNSCFVTCATHWLISMTDVLVLQLLFQLSWCVHRCL